MLKRGNIIAKKTLFSLQEIISEMLIHGISVNPRIVDMDSFSPEKSQDVASDIYHSDVGYAFYYISLATSEKWRLAHTELKLYFHSGKLEKIGIGVSPGVRISSILKKIKLPYVVFFEENFKNGAIVFDNDFMLQFSHLHPRHSDFMLTEIQTQKSENFQRSNREHCASIFPLSTPICQIKSTLTPKPNKEWRKIFI